MAEGQDLVLAREDDRVLAHHPAAAHDGKADRTLGPGSGDPVAGADGGAVEDHPPASGGGLAQHEGGAGGGVHLPSVVGLEDLDVEVRGRKGGGGQLDQPHQHVHAQREVAGPHDGNPQGRLGERIDLPRRKSGGADDKSRSAPGRRLARQGHGGGRGREVDHDVGGLEGGRAVDEAEVCGVGPVEPSGQDKIGRRLDGVGDGEAHAPQGAGDGDADGRAQGRISRGHEPPCPAPGSRRSMACGPCEVVPPAGGL